MDVPYNAAVLAFANAHHGLVTIRAWTESGLGRSSFYRALSNGQLSSVLPGVAALPGTPVRLLHRVAAVVLRLGPGVLVSHRTAAWVWGAPVDLGPVVELITTRASHRTTLPGVVLHLPGDRRTLRARIERDLPVTAPVRTLLDVGSTDPTAVVPALETFVRRGLTTLPAVLSALERSRRRGRPGVRALESVIRELGGVITDSELENAMRRLFRRNGIDGWIFHEVVDGYEVDFCFPAQRVIVEVDGWLVHAGDARRWDRDLERDSILEARGWLVVHLSWRMVVRQPDACAARLRATLRQRTSFSAKN